jgi:hypothetical protein
LKIFLNQFSWAFFGPFCGFLVSAEFALGDGTGAGWGVGAGLATASRLCWPRALASRVTRELSIPVSATVACGRAAAIEVAAGAVGRGILAAVEGCFAVTGGGGTARVSFGAGMGGFGCGAGLTCRAKVGWGLLGGAGFGAGDLTIVASFGGRRAGAGFLGGGAVWTSREEIAGAGFTAS